jgi:hypothetical protein
MIRIIEDKGVDFSMKLYKKGVSVFIVKGKSLYKFSLKK